MNRPERCDGFTLVEAVFSIALLAITAAGISSLYITGLQSLEGESAHMLLDSRLRGELERRFTTPFASLYGGTGTSPVDVDGSTFTATWSGTPADLDGDGTAESDALHLKVVLEGRSLTVLVVDTEGRVGVVP